MSVRSASSFMSVNIRLVHRFDTKNYCENSEYTRYVSKFQCMKAAMFTYTAFIYERLYNNYQL